MQAAGEHRYRGDRAGLATMHGIALIKNAGSCGVLTSALAALINDDLVRP